MPQGNELDHRAPKRIRLSEPQPIASEKDMTQQILAKVAEIIGFDGIASLGELVQAVR